LLPAGIALTVLAFDRDLSAWKRFAPWTGPLVFVGIVASWIVFAALRGPDTYSVWGAFEKHVLSRAIHGMHHKQPPWYYLTVLPVQLLPWSALVPGAILLAWRRRNDATDRFLLVHAIFVCVFFSIWTEKRDLYVLPAYPAFALLASRLLVAGNRWTTIPFALTGVLLLGVGAGLPLAVSRALPGLACRLPPALALVAAGIATPSPCSTVGRRHRARSMIGWAPSIWRPTWVYLRFDAIKSARALGERIRHVAGPAHERGEPVLVYGLGNVVQGIAFYSDGVYVRAVDDLGAIATHLAGDRTAYAVVDTSDFERLPEALRARLNVSGRFEMSRLRVLIVSNTAVMASSGREAPSNRGRP
jgi:hypothetical protein